MPLVTKSILVDDFAVNIDSPLLGPDGNTIRKSFFEGHDSQIRYVGMENCHGEFRCWRWRKGSYQWVRLWTYASPMSDLIRRASTEILDFHKTYRLSGVGNIQFDFRNPYICSEVAYSSVFHLGDYLLGLLPRLNHLVSLLSVDSDGFEQQNNLENASQGQQRAKPPIETVEPISFSGQYRHGGKFADSYGTVCIFVALIASIPISALGLILTDEGWLRVGRCVFILGLILNISACTSGIIGCLPWDWHRCLCDSQKHSQNQVFHIHSGAFCQNTGSMPSSCVSRMSTTRL